MIPSSLSRPILSSYDLFFTYAFFPQNHHIITHAKGLLGDIIEFVANLRVVNKLSRVLKI